MTHRAGLLRHIAPIAASSMLFVTAAADLSGQVIETPDAFDSGGQLRSITPPMAARLQLRAPAWPVTGAFVEARLYGISTGGFVIAVERGGGVVARYALTAEQRETLRVAVTGAMERSGRVVGEERPLVISEPARGAFVRNQMILTGILYAPALAALTQDGSTGAAVYLLATGASYFMLTAASRHMPVSRAQNHLATDGAVRGALMANGLLFAAGEENPSVEVGSLVTLAGGIGGALIGFGIGRGLTDSEAKASTAGSTLLGVTTLGTLGALDLVRQDSDQAAVGATVAAALVGFPLGLAYPRRARYTVTAGDVDMLVTGAALGVATAMAPFVDSNTDDRILWAAATSGLVAGAMVGDRAFVRRYDYTTAEAAQVRLGAAAGGLIGWGLATSFQAEARAMLALTTLGAIAGTTAAQRLVAPRPAAQRRTSWLDHEAAGSRRAPRFELAPTGLVLAVAGVPARHALVTLRF